MKATLNGAPRRLKELARKHGTPLLLISRGSLRARLERFRKALPRVEPFFAIKANSHPEIVKAMVTAGASFDVASIAEMDAVLAAGASPERIIFANTVKPVPSISAARERGVDLMTFDSSYELDKIAAHYPGARVLVRTKVPNVGSIVELNLKFGAEPTDATSLLFKAHKLGLRPAGVSFHVGSQCTRLENYTEALEIAAIIAREARLKQIPFEIVDIGGGFPIRHFDHEDDPFDRMAGPLGREIDRLFDPTVRIIAEPGRFIVGPSAVLVMRVIGKAIRESKMWYYLDDGLYGSLSGQVFDHCKYQFKYLRGGPTRLSTLAGPTCDSFDIIARSEEVPELQLDDLVYVENIGAYSAASATEFNGMPRARVLLIP